MLIMEGIGEESIDDKIQSLPTEIRREIVEYVESLVEMYSRHRNKFLFDWEGKLKNLRNRMSSVELQHKALEWR